MLGEYFLRLRRHQEIDERLGGGPRSMLVDILVYDSSRVLDQNGILRNDDFVLHALGNPR
ncbi:hypothetical protein D3C73_1663200 [compost metagenome]